MPNACVDTNIWIYAVALSQGGESEKNRISQTLLHTLRTPLLTPQIVNELGYTLRRKRVWDDDTLKQLFSRLLDGCPFHIPSRQWHHDALRLRDTYGFSYWDSLVVASAIEAGCDTLYSEDMQHGQVVAGQLSIVNPFR